MKLFSKAAVWATVCVGAGLTSCSAPTYLAEPAIQYPSVENIYTFGIQNRDEMAKVEPDALTAHYENFDVIYKISDNMVVSMTINNKSNKSLIIDKSKSYVLYDGYSSELFKDVRSTRSTTFNNVQDAINNVQTNEAGVSMTVPPYSKYDLPLQETNVREIKKMPTLSTEDGIHNLTPFDNPETVEFVIPYSYDYALGKWDTSRNLIYINSQEVKSGYITVPLQNVQKRRLSNNQMSCLFRSGTPDYSELDRVNAVNQKRFKKHKKMNYIAPIVLAPFTFGGSLAMLMDGGCSRASHRPPVYTKK